MVYLKPLILGLKSRSPLRLITFFISLKMGKMYRKKRRFWESFSKGMESFGQTCTHYFPKTHGVYMYGCSRFIASTAEA